MNFAMLAGHLGEDPKVRMTPNGQKVTSFSLAVRIRRSGKDETVWWRVTVWGDRFDKMMTYLKKGSPVIVNGEVGKPQIWTNKEGQPQVSLDITAESLRFSPFGKGDGSSGGSHQEPSMNQVAQGFAPGGFAQQPAPVGASAFGQGPESSAFDEEMPF